MRNIHSETATLLVAAFLAAIIVSPAPIMKTDRLELDPASYLSHGFTMGLDFDLDYQNEPYDRRGYFNEETNLPNHPIGPGVMAAPFIAIFSVADRVAGHEVINDHNLYAYSWSKFGFFFSGIVYFFGGLLLLRNAFTRMSPSIHPAISGIASLGSGLAYYTFHDGFLGHQFEFFCLALSVWAAVRAWGQQVLGRSGHAFLSIAAFGIALGHLVRPANLNTVLLPFIVYLLLTAIHERKHGELAVVRRISTAQIFHFSPYLLVLALIYNSLYGAPFPLPSDMYAGRGSVEGVTEAASEGLAGILDLVLMLLSRLQYVPGIVFGSEFGLLYCSTVALLGTIAIFLLAALRGTSTPLLASGLAAVTFCYIAVPGAVVLYWQTTASAYGWRYLFSIIPLGLAGIVAFHAYLSNAGAKGIRRVVFSLLVVLSLFGVLGQAFWGTSEKLHFNPGPNTFEQMHGSGNCCSGMGYVENLTSALVEPGAWLTMLAHRFPGYAAFRSLDVLGIDTSSIGSEVGLSASKIQAGMDRYGSAPPSADLQVLLVFTFCTFGIWATLFHRPARRETMRSNAREKPDEHGLLEFNAG